MLATTGTMHARRIQGGILADGELSASCAVSLDWGAFIRAVGRQQVCMSVFRGPEMEQLHNLCVCCLTILVHMPDTHDV